MDINLEYKKTQVNKVNQGTYFKLRPTETAPVWVMTKHLRLILAISMKILIMKNSSKETEKYT